MELSEYNQITKYLKEMTIPEGYTEAEAEHLAQKSNKFQLKGNLLYRKHKQHPLQVIKTTEKDFILFGLHNLSGHFGKDNTIQKARKRFWWYTMDKDIREYVSYCDICQRRGKPQQREPLHPNTNFFEPFDQIGIDLVGPLPITPRGNRYIVVATDYLTKWPEVKAIPEASANAVAKFLFENIVCRYGCPSILLSDQGTHFKNDLIENLCHQLGIRHKYSSTYYPQTNGLTERYNRTLVETLAKISNHTKTNWDNYIPAALFAYRILRQNTTQQEPFYLLYGKQAKLPMEAAEDLHVASQTPYKDNHSTRMYSLLHKLTQSRQDALMKIHRAQNRQKEYHDNKFAMQPILQPEDLVLLYRSAQAYSKSDKLNPKWQGPYRIH